MTLSASDKEIHLTSSFDCHFNSPGASVLEIKVNCHRLRKMGSKPRTPDYGSDALPTEQFRFPCVLI